MAGGQGSAAALSLFYRSEWHSNFKCEKPPPPYKLYRNFTKMLFFVCFHDSKTSHASVWCYATCGTELAYGAMRCAVLSSLRYWCYVLCGTELAYGATSLSLWANDVTLDITSASQTVHQ
eukprot:1521156-Rhodomonas_salina.1